MPTVAEDGRQPIRKKFTMPHAYVILFVLSAIAAAMTYVVPAGQCSTGRAVRRSSLSAH